MKRGIEHAFCRREARRILGTCACAALAIALHAPKALAAEPATDMQECSEAVVDAVPEATPAEAAVSEGVAGLEQAAALAADDESVAGVAATDPVAEPAVSQDASAVDATPVADLAGGQAAVADAPQDEQAVTDEPARDESAPAQQPAAEDAGVALAPETPETPETTRAAEPTALATQEGTKDATAPAAAASAQVERPANGTYVIRMDGTQKLVLTVNGKTAKAGANVKAASYTGTNNQKWVVVYDEARKRYRLFVAGTSRKLALGAKKEGKTVNVCVLAAKIASLKSILWSFVCAKDGAYRLANAAYSGKRLDVAGGKVKKGASVIIAARRKTGADQTQRYEAFNVKPKVKAGKARLEGSYNAVIDANQKVGVGVKKGSVVAGASAILEKAGASLTQRLYLQRDAKGFYSVWVVGSGKVLDVKGASVLPGSDVLQADSTQKDSQKWAVVAKANADGTYTVTLQNKATGLFLGAAKAASGANLAGVDGRDTGKLVTFRLRPRDMLDAGIYEIKPTSTSGVSLNVSHALADNTKKGSLVLYKDMDSLAERFELVDAEGANTWRIRTGSSGGWVSWDGGTSVVQAGAGSDAATGANTWRLTFANGGFNLINVASGKALEMKGGSRKSGTKIWAADPTGLAAQTFSFESSSLFGGRYVALETNAGKRAKAGTTNNATVQLAKPATYLSQMFCLESSGGAWRLRDYNGRYLTTTGTAAKTDVVTRDATGKADQLWEVRIADGGGISLVSTQTGLALVAASSKPQLGKLTAAAARWAVVDRTVDAMKERMAQIATHFAEHDAHGYSQPNRGAGPKETITVRDGAQVVISSADVDCSELVRQCVNDALAVLGRGVIDFLWTGNEDELLRACGFTRIAFSSSAVQRGDILWRSGHTGVALGAKKQAEALGDEYGGIYGYNRGDQTGREVGINTLGSWTYIYRLAE